MSPLIMIPAGFLFLALMWAPSAIVARLDAKKAHRDALAFGKKIEDAYLAGEDPYYRSDLFR